MRYYISDLHFYHARMNNYMDKRGFENLETMHNHMISQWNSRVRRNDEIVILGDFSMGNGEQTNDILRQLKGKKYLVTGNHDDKFLRDKKFNQNQFVWVKPYAELKDNKRKVILHHSPIFCYPGQYHKTEDGTSTTYMLYGHVHMTHDADLVKKFINITRETEVLSRGKDIPEPIPCHMINCFCMRSNYIPLTLDEWIQLEEREYGIS